MIPIPAAIAALLAFALIPPVFAKRVPRKAAVKPPQADCKTLSDSLARLYDAGDPTYLTWDFTEAKCDSSQLYSAYYYQGIGFLFISAWKEALYFLNAAREIGGPRDEEILYHLWTVYRKLDRYPDMERLTLELHQRYPSSLFLLEILDQWKAVKSPSRVAWTFTSRVGIASNPYLDNQFANRMQGETRQQSGRHRFRERASISLSSQFDRLSPQGLRGFRLLHGFQANLGLEYGWNGFTAETGWGAGYETRAQGSSLLVSSGPQSILIDSNWNFAQGRAAAGYSFTTAGGWNLGWNASLFQLNRDWRVAGLSHSQSVLFPAFILLGYIEAQRHWMRMPAITILTEPVPKEAGLDGMYSLNASLTPYFTHGRHSFGIGPAYYLARSQYTETYADGRKTENYGWQHSIAATGTYGFEVRRWCRIAVTGSWGFDIDKEAGASGYDTRSTYGADAGTSFSF